MRWFRFGRGKPQTEGPAGPTAERARGGAPYSPQYEVIVGQGHDHPTPFFNAPALVWHVGVWPKPEHDPHGNPPSSDQEICSAGSVKQRTVDADATRLAETGAKTSIRNRGEVSRERRRAWVEEIDAQLARMQKHRASTPPNPVKKFVAAGQKPPDAGSIVFTMWWKLPEAPEDQDRAIRVKVHCNLTPDYVTYSLYMDVPTPWGGQQKDHSPPHNPRRAEIMAKVADIRRICDPREEQRKQDASAKSRYAQVDPDLLNEDDDKAILNARNVLFVDIWERFIEETGCSLEAFAGNRGELFANFRGLVLGVAAMKDHKPASERFPRFSQHPRFNRDGAEANAVVDAYWPLVRRIVPFADFREFVACGLLGWRVLYITALGSPAQYDENEERPATRGDKSEADIRVGIGAGDAPADSCVRRRYAGTDNNHPVRYLMLTKEGLNPRQLGRIVERINALGTLRLYALKDWAKIVEADATIRILGQELDEITRKWSDMRNLLERFQRMRDFQNLVCEIRRHKLRTWFSQLFRRRRATGDHSVREDAPGFARLAPYLRNVDVPGPLRWFRARVWTAMVGLLSMEIFRFLAREEASRVIDIKYGVLSEISRELETSLIEIGAELDRQGNGVAGGLHFRVNRSGVHVDEFYNLLKLLQIGNIQTWTSYKQFVDRGLEPSFAYIRSVGTRIHALRERLIAVLETIETSALVGQSSATRHNTGELRRIMSFVLIFIALYLLLNKQELFEGARRLILDLANRVDWSVITGFLESVAARLRR